MKILLIEPAKTPLTIGGDDVFLYEPLALEYVAAGVAEDHALVARSLGIIIIVL